MTNEEKQALIEYAKLWIANADAARDEIPFGFDEDTEKEVSLVKVALASLTAQPINLSSCRTLWYDHDDLSAEVKCIPVKDIKKAIRAAGYEVKE